MHAVLRFSFEQCACLEVYITYPFLHLHRFYVHAPHVRVCSLLWRRFQVLPAEDANNGDDDDDDVRRNFDDALGPLPESFQKGLGAEPTASPERLPLALASSEDDEPDIGDELVKVWDGAINAAITTFSPTSQKMQPSRRSTGKGVDGEEGDGLLVSLLIPAPRGPNENCKKRGIWG